MNQHSFVDWVEKVEQRLYGLPDDADDQALFIGSYLQGHFAVEAAKAINAQEYSLEALDQQMQQSLKMAFAAGELEAVDQQQVLTLWQSLIKPTL